MQDQHWEYKMIPGYSDETELNQLGKEGWELVSVVAGGLAGKKTVSMNPSNQNSQKAAAVFVYLKRPVKYLGLTSDE